MSADAPERGDREPDAWAGPGGDEAQEPERRPAGPRQRPETRRFPAWLALPVATLGGFVAAEWPGAVFGAVAGFFLWRGRR